MTEVALYQAVRDNLGVRLPAVVARAAHLHFDQWVCVSVEDGRVISRPVVDAPLSVEKRLARSIRRGTAVNHG